MARQANTQTLSMSLQGDEELQAAIAAIVKETDDLRPAWDKFYRPSFHEAMEQVFDTRQSGTWRPLKPRYAKWKAAHGGGSMMVLNRDLKDSLVAKTGESVYRPARTRMTIGSTNIPTNTPRGRMIVWADSTAMKYHISNAAREHAEWYAKKWSGR